MPLDRCLWAVLEGEPGRARDSLRRYLPALAHYASGKGCVAGEALAVAERALSRAADPAFLGLAARQRLAVRPMLFALLQKTIPEVRRWVSLREEEIPEVVEVKPVTDADFDRAWVLTLLRAAMEQLIRESPALGQAVALTYGHGCSPAEVSDRMGRPAKILLEEARRGLRRLLRAEVETYVSSAEEFRLEVAELERRL